MSVSPYPLTFFQIQVSHLQATQQEDTNHSRLLPLVDVQPRQDRQRENDDIDISHQRQDGHSGAYENRIPTPTTLNNFTHSPVIGERDGLTACEGDDPGRDAPDQGVDDADDDADAEFCNLAVGSVLALVEDCFGKEEVFNKRVQPELQECKQWWDVLTSMIEQEDGNFDAA